MTTDLVVPETKGLQRVQEAGGVLALALMDEEEFQRRLVALKTGQERMRRIQRELMVADEDFGKIPGTDKPTLLKAGAEKACHVYGLVPSFEETWIEGDGVTTPHLRLRVKCHLHRGSLDGPVVGEGGGAANSWEKKHRYRHAQRSCPACGTVGSIRRSKYPDRDTGDKGWWCREESCKANFRSDDPSVTDQVLGDVENPDPYDVENTLLKMACKRAQVDAVLRTTATSGLFTQDMEDVMDAGDGPSPRPRAEAPTSQPASPRAASAPATRPAAKAQGQQRQNATAQGECPRCHMKGTVLASKFKAGTLVCWKTRDGKKGCGYEWTLDDQQVHEHAAEERAQSPETFQPNEDDTAWLADDEPGSRG